MGKPDTADSKLAAASSEKMRFGRYPDQNDTGFGD